MDYKHNKRRLEFRLELLPSYFLLAWQGTKLLAVLETAASLAKRTRKKSQFEIRSSKSSLQSSRVTDCTPTLPHAVKGLMLRMYAKYESLSISRRLTTVLSAVACLPGKRSFCTRKQLFSTPAKCCCKPISVPLGNRYLEPCAWIVG